MDDLKQYHSIQDEVSRLNAEIVKLQYRLNRELRNKSKIKCKYDKLYAKHVCKPVTRSDKARELIKQKWSGEIDITLIAISKKCFLSYATIRELSSEYKKATD